MLRVGIVGTNFISEWFTEAARNTGERVEPAAVYSRSMERAEEFAARQEIAGAFDDLTAMGADVDAVYIASPTIAHYGQAMATIEAGKHVLVEKTITASHDEAARLFERAEANGVVIMEATRHLHLPEYELIRDAVARLGTVRYVHFEMLQYSSRYDRFRAGEHLNAFDPTLGNSALVDIGVYCLEPVIDLFGAPRSHAGASIRLDNGFDASGSIQLNYGEMIADVVYSKIAQGVGPSTIVGEKGALTIDSLSEPSRVTLRDGDGEVALLDIGVRRPAETMHHELIAFADQVERGEMNPRWKNVTLAARQIMDEHLARTAGH